MTEGSSGEKAVPALPGLARGAIVGCIAMWPVLHSNGVSVLAYPSRLTGRTPPAPCASSAERAVQKPPVLFFAMRFLTFRRKTHGLVRRQPNLPDPALSGSVRWVR
jgi:hypothetical protein